MKVKALSKNIIDNAVSTGYFTFFMSAKSTSDSVNVNQLILIALVINRGQIEGPPSTK